MPLKKSCGKRTSFQRLMTEYNDVQSLHIAKEERADSLLFFLLIDYYFEKLLLASQMNWTGKNSVYSVLAHWSHTNIPF